MTLRLRVGRLLALLLIVIAQLGATPILASTTPTPTGTTTAPGTPAPSSSSSVTATSSVTPTAVTSAAASVPTAVTSAAASVSTPSSAPATTTTTDTVSLTGTLTPMTPATATSTSATGAASATTGAYTPTAPLTGTSTPSITTARLLVQRIAVMRMQAEATGAPAPTITAVLFSGSAANPTITITGVGFGSPSAPETPGCGGFIANNGAVYSDLALGDDDPTHGFYAGGPGSCIGLVNLSYSDTQISYQFGSGYANYRWLYTLGQGDSYSLGVKGASFCGSVDYSGQPAANTCPPVPATPTPVSGLIPWHSHQSVRFAAGLGASVDLADGHVDVGAADMSIPGRGPQLALNRTWDSLLAQRGVTTTAGEGWQSSLTPQLGGVLTATVSYTDDSGAAWDFIYSGDPSATGPYTTYTSPPGLPWQLTASSAGYTLTNFLTGATRTFDSSGRLSATADSYGNSDAMVDDGTDQAGGALVDSGGRTIAYSYTNGLVGEEASPLWQSSGGTQGQHVTAAYNGVGQLTTQTLGAGTADAVTTTFGYSGTQLVTVTTGMGHQWLLGNDDQGRVAAITNTDTTPAYVTQFLYNPGQTVAIEGFGQPHQRATIYALDGQGQALSVQDAVGDTTTYTYDQQHDVASRADANNASGHDTTTHYAYTYAGPNGYLGPDGNVGLLTQETSPPVGTYSPQSVLAPQTTTYQYDPHTFDLVEVDKPGGGKTRYSYDGHHGRVATIELVNTTSSGCGGQQAQLVRPSVAQPPSAAILVARAMAAPVACGTSQHTFYQWRGQLTNIDAAGEITGTTDARGVTVAPTEDTATPVAGPNAVAAAYTRQDGYTDAVGNDVGDLTSASSAPITTTRGANAPVTTGYAYDQDGNPITTTTPNGALIVAAYDHLGRPVRTTRPGVALSVFGPTVTISTGLGYDGDGNVITTTDGAGDLTRVGYDALGRLAKTINPVGATTVYTYSGPVLTDVQDTMGHLRHDDYDGTDRLIGTTDPMGVHQRAMVREEGREVLKMPPRMHPAQRQVRRHALELRRVVADQDLYHGHILLDPVRSDRRRVKDLLALLDAQPRHMLLQECPKGIRVEVHPLRQPPQRRQDGGGQPMLRQEGPGVPIELIGARGVQPQHVEHGLPILARCGAIEGIERTAQDVAVLLLPVHARAGVVQMLEHAARQPCPRDLLILSDENGLVDQQGRQMRRRDHDADAVQHLQDRRLAHLSLIVELQRQGFESRCIVSLIPGLSGSAA